MERSLILAETSSYYGTMTNMKITNFDDVNQFVKREYRKGWTLGA